VDGARGEDEYPAPPLVINKARVEDVAAHNPCVWQGYGDYADWSAKV